MPNTTKLPRQLYLHLLRFITVLCLTTIPLSPTVAAERIKLVYGSLSSSLSVDCLETYAKTGEITDEFRFYAKFMDKQSLTQLRHWLQKRFDTDKVSLYKYTHSPEGKELLQQLGNVFTTHSERNGFYSIRAALIEAADNPDGWTAIDAINEFPTDNLQLNIGELFKLKKFWQDSVTADRSDAKMK